MSDRNAFFNIEPSKKIRVNKNDIFFTSSITTESIDYLIDCIQKIVQNDEKDSHGIIKEINNPAKIYMYMDSPGGNLNATFKFIDYIDIMRHSNRLHLTIIGTGMVASAATLMGCVADEFYVTKYTTCLIHELSSMTWGKLSYIESHFKSMKQMHSDMIDIYKRKNEKFTSEYLDKILSKESIFSASEYVETGFADGIFGHCSRKKMIKTLERNKKRKMDA